MLHQQLIHWLHDQWSESMEQLYCKIMLDYVKVWFKSPLFPVVDNCVQIKVIDPRIWKKNVLLCLCTICQHTWHNIGHKVPYISTGKDGPPVHLAPCLKPSRPTKYRIDQIRSNSNFAWNSYRCAFEDSRPIITKFGTRHDSRTVVTCTKFRYDRPTIIEIRGTRIFSKFWIRSNLSIRYLVGQG